MLTYCRKLDPYPVTLTIRKFNARHFTIDDLIRAQTLSESICSLGMCGGVNPAALKLVPAQFPQKPD